MQIPYHIETSLANYYALFISGRWEFPDFSDRCLICFAKNCAKYHGTYTRGAISPDIFFCVPDLPCARYLCQGKGDRRSSDHKTFSLLPYQLTPYRQLTIQFMVRAVSIKNETGLGGIKALDKIEREFTNPDGISTFISQWALSQWDGLMRDAFKRFIESEFYKTHPGRHIISGDDPNERMFGFLTLATLHKTRYLRAPKRGPDEMAFDFYRSNDSSEQLAPFLFGLASQHRN